jgi:hypothetical protein
MRVIYQGKTIGWAGYQNTADVWCEGIGPTENTIRTGESWKHCSAPEEHSLVWVTLTTARDDTAEAWEDAERYKLKACLGCMALVSPPHDGYVYHDYNCDLAWREHKKCSCGEG